MGGVGRASGVEHGRRGTTHLHPHTKGGLVFVLRPVHRGVGTRTLLKLLLYYSTIVQFWSNSWEYKCGPLNSDALMV